MKNTFISLAGLVVHCPLRTSNRTSVRKFSTLLFVLWLLPVSGEAEDIYVSQDGVGSTNSLAWLNNIANWGYGEGKVSAGDTVYLVGTMISPLVVAGSGTEGNPIKIRFTTDAKFETDYFTKAIDIGGRSNLIIDGGINGIITATNNGTLLGNRKDTTGIMGSGIGNNIEIKNLTISNLFKKIVLPDGNPTNEQPTIRGILLGFTDGASEISIHNNRLVHVGNAITFNYGKDCTNVAIFSNLITEVSFGIFLNCAQYTGGYQTGWHVSNNTCTNFSSYDGNWGTGSGEHNHNNFLIVNSMSDATNQGLRIDGNVAGGACGKYMTSLIKITPNFDTFQEAMIINNLLVNSDPSAFIANSFISSMLCPDLLIANNTIVNAAGPGAATSGIAGGETSTIRVYNNLFLGVTRNLVDSVTAGGRTNGFIDVNFNAYQTLPSDNMFYGNGATFRSWADWTNYFPGGRAFDKHSTTNRPFLRANYVPMTNDNVVVRSGTNLSAYFKTDYYGNPRAGFPTNWTIGAFEVVRDKDITQRPSPASKLRKDEDFPGARTGQ